MELKEIIKNEIAQFRKDVVEVLVPETIRNKKTRRLWEKGRGKLKMFKRRNRSEGVSKKELKKRERGYMMVAENLKDVIEFKSIGKIKD